MGLTLQRTPTHDAPRVGSAPGLVTCAFRPKILQGTEVVLALTPETAREMGCALIAHAAKARDELLALADPEAVPG